MVTVVEVVVVVVVVPMVDESVVDAVDALVVVDDTDVWPAVVVTGSGSVEPDGSTAVLPEPGPSVQLGVPSMSDAEPIDVAVVAPVTVLSPSELQETVNTATASTSADQKRRRLNPHGPGVTSP